MSDRLFYGVLVVGLMLLSYGWGYIHGNTDDKYRP